MYYDFCAVGGALRKQRREGDGEEGVFLFVFLSGLYEIVRLCPLFVCN